MNWIKLNNWIIPDDVSFANNEIPTSRIIVEKYAVILEIKIDDRCMLWERKYFTENEKNREIKLLKGIFKSVGYERYR